MSSSDAQPPLSRREARERERAAAANGQPATPPPTVAAPVEAEEWRRPGSHAAPAPGSLAQSNGPGIPSSAGGTGVSPFPPASATEIVPGTGGLTRRQLRQLRATQGQTILPVPLQNPTPQSSDRTVQDVLGTVATLEEPGGSAGHDGPAPVDEAVVAQATEPDGSPAAVEPFEQAVAHAEEPRRHRSTWAPHDDPDALADDVPSTDEADVAPSDAAPTEIVDVVPPADSVVAALPETVPPSVPGVFPLSLDADRAPSSHAEGDPDSSTSAHADDLDSDTNEVPVQQPTADAPRTPAAFQRPVEPKPVTTAFSPPAGHWSQLANDSNDSEVHDEETGTRRVAVTNTNSLILPNSALADPTGALNATGEVILTGSIDLPASLSSTGSHRPIDGAEVDRLLEQHDEQPDTDASPVRASRAVSSHTSTRQVVLAAAKPKESRTPLILGVTVGVVGLAAATVIVVALITTHAFGG